MYVYKITNKITQKLYVGITRNKVWSRYRRHYTTKDRFDYVGQMMRQYGFHNFTVETIDEASSLEDLRFKERKWIKELGTLYPNGYNLTEGGEGTYQRNGLRERQKMRRLLGPLPISDETRRKMSVAQRVRFTEIPNWWKGKSRVIPPHIMDALKRGLRTGKGGNQRPDLAITARKWAANPNYANSMEGKARPDLAERNRDKSIKRNHSRGLEHGAKMNAGRERVKAMVHAKVIECRKQGIYPDLPRIKEEVRQEIKRIDKQEKIAKKAAELGQKKIVPLQPGDNLLKAHYTDAGELIEFGFREENAREYRQRIEWERDCRKTLKAAQETVPQKSTFEFAQIEDRPFNPMPIFVQQGLFD